MLNLSPLFYSTEDPTETLLHRMSLNPWERDAMAQAKTDVRNCLREGIPRLLKAKGLTTDAPVPRFFTQGSWSYHTLNTAAHLPPQQADLDDGCYMPLSFMTTAPQPSVAAEAFFAITGELLAALANRRGWKFITDDPKPTCQRLVITPYAHIDVPLYAIPDVEFATLTKAAVRDHGYLDLEEAVRNAERDAWTRLPRDVVLLAHRLRGWTKSDPRPIKDWFLAAVTLNGEQLRRVVRYLKGLRDWNWVDGGPSSILLMAAAVPLFSYRDKREDLALLEVVERLPSVLRTGVKNPVDASESLTDRLGQAKVEQAAKVFEKFAGVLRASLAASNAGQACEWMRQQFGGRFPSCPDRIKLVSVAATVASAPAVAGPSELLGRHTSG